MNRSLIFGTWLLSVLLSVTARSAEAPNIVITLDRVADKPVELLNSKATTQLMLDLSGLHHAGVPDRPTLLLVHPEVTLGEIYNVLGMMVKAQAASPRIYVFSKDKRSMNEMVFGPSVQFSTNLTTAVAK